MSKKQIEIYVDNLGVNTEPETEVKGGCGCGCGSGSTGGYTTEQLVENFSRKYKELGEIKVINAMKEDRKGTIERLNEIFKNSGERLVVKESNFDFTISKVTPLIVADDKIVSVKTIPDATQLYEAIQSGERITAKSGCC